MDDARAGFQAGDRIVRMRDGRVVTDDDAAIGAGSTAST